ncbi:MULTISPECIES: metallophosphoesterase [Paenibacillus]|uniref:Calcineurin-like phosphoesterase domain-containing protein n=1 Tax=Paenibacillus lautus TaxID=1401 RepID=A0A1R1ANE7_PAELA|nr:metallophosphoesterase [Paenibacillus lautus]OME87073.1 hypothetical protein BK123_31990 [Paenibacillus lautus]
MKPGGRILAVADIHGHGLLLEQLLEHAGYRPDQDRLFLLGDYVNKGPDSEGTLALIESLCKEGAVALSGNNEQKWLNNGISTQWTPFLRALPFWSRFGGYLFVHAGIRPGVPIEHQTVQDLTEIRDPFFAGRLTGRETVVFGHTPASRLGASHGQIWLGDRRIGIDTGAGHGEYLTLVDLSGEIAYSMLVTSGSNNIKMYTYRNREIS